MKKLAIILALLFFTSPANAGPLNWARHQFRDHPVRMKLIFASVAAGVHAYGLNHCRHFAGVENCQSKYGAAWATYGVATGLNFAMIPVSEKLPVKEGYAFSFAGSAAQLGHGIYEWRIKPEQVRH